MRQFFDSVPNDLLEAARIGGMGEFVIFCEVAPPLVCPALASLAIFAFLGNSSAFLRCLTSRSSRVPCKLDWRADRTGRLTGLKA